MIPEPYTLSDADLEALPGPIAVPASRYATERDPRIKLLLMIDTIETILKYGSAIVVQVMRRANYWEEFDQWPLDKRTTPPRGKSIRDILKRPQLGEHLKILKEANKFYRAKTEYFRHEILDLVTVFTENKLGDKLIDLRDQRKGHGAWPSEEVAAASLAEFGDSFGKLLSHVRALNFHFPLYLEPAGVMFSGPGQPLIEDAGVMRLSIKGKRASLSLYPFFLAQGSGSVVFNGIDDNKNASNRGVTFLDYGSGADRDEKTGSEIADDFTASFVPDRWKLGTIPRNNILLNFTGRADDLLELDTFVQWDFKQVLVIHGERGVGKSTLLQKWWEVLLKNTDAPARQRVYVRHIISNSNKSAKPKEIATTILRGLDNGMVPQHDWKASRFREAIANCLRDRQQPCVILIDGLDECEAELSRTRDSLFDWIPDPLSTGPNVKWVLGLRTYFLSSRDMKALRDPRQDRHDQVQLHEVKRFNEEEVRDYLHLTLDSQMVDAHPEVLPLVVDRTQGLPLNLFLLKEAIARRDGHYSESFLLTFQGDDSNFIRDGIRQMTALAGEMEISQHFPALEWPLGLDRSAGKLSKAEYDTQCNGLKRTARSRGESRFLNLLALFVLAKENLTERNISDVLNMTDEEAEGYLTLVSRFLKEEQDGYSFSQSAFQEHIAENHDTVVRECRTKISTWCCDPANRTHGYVIRNGASHLIDDYSAAPSEEKAERLTSLLTDLDFITVKIRAGMVPELLQDYEQALTYLTGSPSSMFHELEVDDEDRSWIAEARAACIAGNTSPYPTRGGASIIAKLKEDYSAFLIKMRSEADIKRQQRLESGLAEESDDDLDDFGLDFLKLPNGETNFSELEFDSEPAEQTEDEIIALSRQCYEENNQGVHDKEKRRFEIAEQIFKSGTITDKAIQKILNGCVNNYSDDRAARIRDFADLVAGSWRQLADTSVDTAAYCSNYRQEGPVHTAGTESMTARSVPWIEQLYRPKGGVRRLRLNFTESDQQGKIGFFKDFSMALRARYKDISGIRQYHFDILDTIRNRQLVTYSGEAPEPRGGSSFPSHSDWPKITDGGSHVYFQDELWELDLKEKVAMRVPSGEELLIRAALMAAPPFRRRSEPTTDYREPVFSEDGYLAADADYYYLHLLETQLGGPVDTNHVPSLSSRFTNDINGKPGSFFFSAESRLIIGRNYKSVPVMDLISGEMIFLQNTDAQQVATTRDGRLLAAQFLGTVRVWDLRTGLELRQFPAHVFESDNLQFSESGELLNVHSEIVDLRTGSRHLRFDENGGGSEFLEKSKRYTITPTHAIDHLRSHKLKGNTGQLSLDQKEEISSIILINEKIVISLENGLVTLPFCLGGIARHFSGFEDLWLLRPAHESPRNCSQSYPSTIASNASTITGKILLAVDDGTLGLLDPQTDTIKLLTDFEYLSNMDHEVGNSIVAIPFESQWDRDERVKREQSVDADHFPQPEPEKSTPKFSIDDAEMTQDGKWILTVTSWDSVRVWRTVDGSCVRAIPLPKAADYFSGRATKIQLSRDGKHCHVAFSSGAIYRLIDWEKPEAVWSLIYEFPREKNVECTSVQNRRYLHMQSYCDNGEVRFSQDGKTHVLCDLENDEHLPLFFDGRDFNTGELLAVTEDSQHLIISSGNEQKDHFIRVLRLKDSSEVLRFPLTSEFQAMSNITPDGRFVVLTKAWDLLRLKLHLPGS